MPKALLTATVLSHIAQFHEPAIALLKDSGYEVHVAACDNLSEKNGLSLSGPDHVFDVPFQRNPLHLGNITAARQLRSILRDGDYDIIHCNTPVAGILTRLLGQRARAAGATLVYTAHGFHFFKGAPLHSWLAYYPLERLFARGADVLVTINKEDYRRAAGFPARRVVYVPGVGVDVDRFRPAQSSAAALRRHLGIPEDALVVLSVGELNNNKNHRTVLRALAQVDAPELRYLICGNGPLRHQLEDLARALGLGERARFLGYRRDIPGMLAVADVFCLPSFREGLPLAVMEAMASGIPVVAAQIRGVEDLIDDGKGGILVGRADDVAGFASALDALSKDPALRLAMGRHDRERVAEFSVMAVTDALADVYGLAKSTARGETP